MSDQLRDAFDVLRALREEPATPKQIAETTGVHWRKVYRLIDHLIDLGAPIAKRGSQPVSYSLTVAGLREWLG